MRNIIPGFSGIRRDNDGSILIGTLTNYLRVDAVGFLSQYGASTFWLDIDFPILIRTTGVGIPTLETLNGNITMPRWQENDFNVCESQEFIHAWKEGSECHWHIHLITNGLDASDRYVRFEIEYGYVATGSAYVFPATIDSGELLIPASTTDRTQFIFSIGSFTPTGVKVGGHCVARLRRIAATGTAPTGDPFCPMLQLHIECDSMGSREVSSK